MKISHTHAITLSVLVCFSITPMDKHNTSQTPSYDNTSHIGTYATIGAVFGIGGLGYAAWKYYNRPYTYKEFLNLVTNNPAKALRYIYRTHNKFSQEIENNGGESIDYNTLYNLLDTYTQKCPTFLLGECTQEDFGPCMLSRDYNPQYRHKFESQVVAAIKQKLHNNHTVEYAGFGSGGAFQELVIAAQALQNTNNGGLNINLIDPKYYTFATTLDALGKTRHINNNVDVTSPNAVKKIADLCRKYEPENVQNMTPDQLENSLKTHMLKEKKEYKQPITFLQTMFPRNNVTLSVYYSTDDYLNKTSQYPDITTACDIEDEMSLLRNSLPNYGKLCLTTQDKKPESHNFLLDKAPSIKQFSLKPHGSDWQEDDISSITEIPYNTYYIKTEKL